MLRINKSFKLISFINFKVLMLFILVACLISGCSNEVNAKTNHTVSGKKTVQNKIEAYCLNESAYVYYADGYKVVFDLDKIKLDQDARIFVYLGLMSFDEISQVIIGYPLEQKYISLEDFKNSNWRAIQKDFDYLGKNSIEVLKSTDDDWSPQYGKRGYFYYKDPSTKKLMEIGFDHLCRNVSVLNKQLFNMGDSSIQMSDLIRQVNLPFQWEAEDPFSDSYLWSSEDEFDTIKEWNVQEKSFYYYELYDYWIVVTADKNGSINPNDYTRIVFPYRLGL